MATRLHKINLQRCYYVYLFFSFFLFVNLTHFGSTALEPESKYNNSRGRSTQTEILLLLHFTQDILQTEKSKNLTVARI